MPNPARVVERVVVLMLENRLFDHMLGLDEIADSVLERSRRHSVEP
jgi:phospholipase C